MAFLQADMKAAVGSKMINDNATNGGSEGPGSDQDNSLKTKDMLSRNSLIHGQ